MQLELRNQSFAVEFETVNAPIFNQLPNTSWCERHSFRHMSCGQTRRNLFGICNSGFRNKISPRGPREPQSTGFKDFLLFW